jgi:hypothetical protein
MRGSGRSFVKIGGLPKCDRERCVASNVLAFRVAVVCVKRAPAP